MGGVSSPNASRQQLEVVEAGHDTGQVEVAPVLTTIQAAQQAPVLRCPMFCSICIRFLDNTRLSARPKP